MSYLHVDHLWHLVLAPYRFPFFQEGQATKKEEGLDSLEGHDDALGDFGMGEDLIGELGEDININDFANLFDGPEGEIPAGGASSASGLTTNSLFLFCFICVKKSIIPCRGKTLFSSVPPSNWNFHWQGHHQVCRAKRGDPRTSTKTAVAKLDRAFVKNALFLTDPWLWNVNWMEYS